MSESRITDKNSDLERGLNIFLNEIKHSSILGITIDSIDDGGLVVKSPYSDKIVGNPETGVIHGGAITSLLDQSCGMAVAQALAPDFDITPTIDLRIDYMKPAQPHKDVFAFVSAYRVTKSVVFTRGVAYQDGDRDNPIAHCVANFIRMGLGTSIWSDKGNSNQ